MGSGKQRVEGLILPGGWNPQYSMSDQTSVLCCQITGVIPSVHVLGGCFFHVMQAFRDRYSALRDHYDTVQVDINALHIVVEGRGILHRDYPPLGQGWPVLTRRKGLVGDNRTSQSPCGSIRMVAPLETDFSQPI